MARRPEFRRLAQAGAFLVVILLGIQCGLWVTNADNLPIRTVQLHGNFQYLKPAQLETVVTSALSGSNMLTQDIDGLEQNLRQHPWVRQARIHRDWPDTLRIEVMEQAPVARWADGDLLNEYGERFALLEGAQPELAQIHGAPGREAALVAYLKEAQALLAGADMQVVRLEETDLRALHITTRSGLRLVLGRIRPLERLARWLRYYPSYLRTVKAQAVAIDLRYPNGFAVRVPTQS